MGKFYTEKSKEKGCIASIIAFIICSLTVGQLMTKNNGLFGVGAFITIAISFGSYIIFRNKKENDLRPSPKQKECEYCFHINDINNSVCSNCNSNI